jgi:hypothetical protein
LSSCISLDRIIGDEQTKSRLITPTLLDGILVNNFQTVLVYQAKKCIGYSCPSGTTFL